MEDPWTDLDVNCRGILALLEALRRENPQARVVFTGSRLEYGRVGADPVAEDARRRSAVPARRAQAGRSSSTCGSTNGCSGSRYAVARITNPYGPGQPRARTAYGVVNRLIHLALAGEPLPIYGDGRQRRDYIYIDDVVEALLRLGERGAATAAFTTSAPASARRSSTWRSAIVAIAGGGRVEYVAWPPLAEQIETGDFVADISRIQRELGWQPACRSPKACERTVAFYRAHVAS